MLLTGNTAHMNKFGRGGQLLRARQGETLSDDQIMRYCPSVFADHAHESRSQRFQHISTANLLDGMRKEGFGLTEVRQGGSKDVNKRGFTKHLLRFRRTDQQLVNDTVPEVILINAHDGTSSYQLMAGLFRLVCSNGLIVADGNIDGVKIGHRGNNVVNDVIEASYTVVKEAENKFPAIEDMRQIRLAPPEVTAFGQSAAMLRFDDDQINDDTVRNVTHSRRMADNEPTLWNVFNRAQENLINGGFSNLSRDANNNLRSRRVREVNGIDGNVKLNKALWTLAESMRAMKHAA